MDKPDNFNRIVTLEGEIQATVKNMIKYRGLYEGAKARERHTALWLEGYRRMVRHKGCFDFDLLLDCLKEIENEIDKS